VIGVVIRVVVVVASLAGCGDPDPAGGVFTESVCPPSDPPTYDSFGATFMELYCTKCHDSAKTGSLRYGAPLGVDLETRALVRQWTANVDKQAAFGPAAENLAMPPTGHPMPTDDQRRRLGAYIACEVAQ
jgi:uncharacterized membrane protein